ncbi:MAG: rRNA maturation RNase YbeY, partial [Verrucomicrobiota bacterium]
ERVEEERKRRNPRSRSLTRPDEGSVSLESVQIRVVDRTGRCQIVPRLEAVAAEAFPRCVERQRLSGRPDFSDEVEVTLVDDPTIAKVHLDFMKVPGPTDVITFLHGEILISLDTADRQAVEFGNDPSRETALYMIHGFLHLLGYEDHEPDAAAMMARAQEAVLEMVWPV